METIYKLLALCVGYPQVTGGFPLQRPVTRRFDVEQTIEASVIWDAVALIMTSL